MKDIAAFESDRLRPFGESDVVASISTHSALNRGAVRPVAQGGPTQLECHAARPPNEWSVREKVGCRAPLEDLIESFITDQVKLNDVVEHRFSH